MKVISIKNIVYLSFLVTMLTSCKKSFFYDGVNNDPNSVTEDKLLPSVLLTGAEYSMGYTNGGDFSRYCCVLTQSVRGATRQFAAYDGYVFANEDFDNVWLNSYTQALNNLGILMRQSDRKGNNYYSGISRILSAYEFGLITDMWGNVPVSASLQGSNVMQPKYDDQQAIYVRLQQMLDSAIAKLSMASGGSTKPGVDDVVYGGSKTKWLQFAHALKARYYLHLSKKDANYADRVLSEVALANGLTDAQIPFTTVETASNPWYQYYRDRFDVTMTGSWVLDKMVSLSDPRKANFIDVTNDQLASHFSAADAPVTLISNTELLFMQAEAQSSKNDAGASATYEAAITSSFGEVGLTPSVAYLSANALTGATHSDRLNQIMTQKGIALLSQPECYNDWRRTGIPSLTPAAGSTIPRRFIYPQTELSYNGVNVPTGTTLYSKVWWDQ